MATFGGEFHQYETEPRTQYKNLIFVDEQYIFEQKWSYGEHLQSESCEIESDSFDWLTCNEGNDAKI